MVRLSGAAVLVDGGVADVYRTNMTHLQAAEDGGAVAVYRGSLTLTSCMLSGNRANRGAAAYAGGGVLILHSSTLDSNEASAKGGALFIEGSAAVLLATFTRLQGNLAPSGSGSAISFAPNSTGSLAYGLPAPPGTWVASSQLCGQDAPCDSARVPSMLGLMVATLAVGTHEDEDFPYDCPPGIVGDSLEPVAQSRPTCARPCPAAFYCPAGTTEPRPCTSGSYCSRGVSWPIPCLPGSFSSATNLTRADECTPADLGFFAPLGSVDQTPCAAGTSAAKGGEQTCTACTADHYQDQTGQALCAPCSNLTACQVGQYRAGCGGSSPGSCTPCTKSDDEYFTLGVLAQIADTCPTATCSNLQCAAGSVRTGSCGVDATRSNDDYECTLCLPGTYAAFGNESACDACPDDHYQHQPGQALCAPCSNLTACQVGQYRAGCGGSSPGSCTPCTAVSDCFFTSDGGTNDSCQTSACASLPACDTGSYRTGCEANRQGLCMPCTKADTEYFTLGAVAQIADACPTANCSNLHCTAGSVRTGSCGVDAKRSNNEYECKACFAGTYAAHGNKSCSKCTAGKYQAKEGQTACEACPPGYHCREGSATPIPCEGGTFGNATGLASPLECTPVGFGEWAPTGSVLPEKCYTGFRCPGRANDKENIPPGSKPILISQGGMATEERVEVVTQELTLDTSLEEYNETEVRHTLAWQLGIPVELIALSVRSGSLLLSVTITTQATSSSSQPPVTTRDLMASLFNASAIGSALGMPVRSYTTPRIRIETRMIEAKCLKGHWCSAGLLVACEEGYFNPTLDAVSAKACTKCPPESTTRTTGAIGRFECECKSSFYDANETEDGVDCQRCPIGTDCQGAATLLGMPIRPGYFRQSNTSDDVRRCPDASENCKGATECPHTTSGCVGSSNASFAVGANVYSLCSEGLTGVFCQLCAETQDRYYIAANGATPAHCERCRDTMGTTVGIGAALVLVAVLVAFCFVRGYRALSDGRKAMLAHLSKVFTLRTKLKILIGFYMIATKISSVYEVRLPEEVGLLLDHMSIVITFGIDLGLAATPLECVGLAGYTTRMLFWIVMPLALIFLILLATSVWLRFRRHQVTCSSVLLAAAPLVLQTLFVIYPIVSRIAFSAFSFYEFKDGSSFLRADVDIKLGSAEHTRAMNVAILGIVLYPVGMPVFFGVLLWCAREAIVSGQPTPLSSATRFLHGDYKALFFWWELAEMLRRFLLLGVLGMVKQGSLEQIAYGGLTSLVLLTIQTVAVSARAQTISLQQCAPCCSPSSFCAPPSTSLARSLS